MKALTLHIPGRRFVRDDAHALYLDAASPEQPLRLGLIVRGTEQLVFPALALDDWGREKKGLSLYRWLYDEGPRFPRAEIFGFDAHGAETQVFLRDLELSFAYPCYVYGSESDHVHEGHCLSAIFISADDESAAQPVKVNPPDHLAWPLRRAAVRWRRTSSQTLLIEGWAPWPTE